MAQNTQNRVEFDAWCSELEKALSLHPRQPEKQLEVIDELVSQLELKAELFQPVSAESGPVYTIQSLCRNQHIAVITITLGKGAVIPPHNHPQMVGYLQVLSGKVLVTSYKSPAKRVVAWLERENEQVLEAGDKSSLTPARANIHQVEALECSHLLDVFAPDYGLRRLPTNYDIITPTDGPFQGVRQVKPTFGRVLKMALKRLQETKRQA